MKTVITISLLLTCLFQSKTLQAASNKDFQAYRDTENRFIFQYPNSWSQVPSTHQRTRIKIVSENGSGRQDCAVNVQVDKSANNMTPGKFVQSAPTTKEFELALRNSMPDAKVIKRGLTYISNQDAIYNIVDFTVRSVGVEVPMRMFVVQTAKDGYVYTVSCRAVQEEFEEHFTDFQIIFAGFLIKP